MNEIVLHGRLVKRFGSRFVMDVTTPREAFFALCSQLEGFEQHVRKAAFRIIREKKGHQIGIDERGLDLTTKDCTIHIYPAMVGAAGGKGTMAKILLGVAIIGITIATSGAGGILAAGGSLGSAGAAMGAGIGFMGLTYGGIAAFGAMLAFGGLAMMFAPSPAAQKTGGGAKNDSSFVVSAPINTMYQGVPVPLVYGMTIVGSVTISSALTIAQLLGAGTTYDGSVDPVFPNYPGITTGVGGTGSGGYRTRNDIGMTNYL